MRCECRNWKQYCGCRGVRKVENSRKLLHNYKIKSYLIFFSENVHKNTLHSCLYLVKNPSVQKSNDCLKCHMWGDMHMKTV